MTLAEQFKLNPALLIYDLDPNAEEDWLETEDVAIVTFSDGSQLIINPMTGEEIAK